MRLPSKTEFEAIRKKAINGDGAACRFIALCFLRGVVVKQNYKHARDWFLKSRRLGVNVDKHIEECNEQYRTEQANRDKKHNAWVDRMDKLERFNRANNGINSHI